MNFLGLLLALLLDKETDIYITPARVDVFHAVSRKKKKNIIMSL